MTEKKYKGRRAYLNDFKKNEEGNYEYQGVLYRWAGEEKNLRRERSSLWIVYAAMMMLLIAAGCMDAPGAMNSFFVILPFAVSFVFGISAGCGLWRLTTGGNPLRAYIYEASVEKLPFRMMGTLICTIATILGEIMYVFRNGFGENAIKIMVFLLLEALISGISLLFLQRIRQMCWEKQTSN